MADASNLNSKPPPNKTNIGMIHPLCATVLGFQKHTWSKDFQSTSCRLFFLCVCVLMYSNEKCDWPFQSSLALLSRVVLFTALHFSSRVSSRFLKTKTTPAEHACSCFKLQCGQHKLPIWQPAFHIPLALLTKSNIFFPSHTYFKHFNKERKRGKRTLSSMSDIHKLPS